MAESSSVAPMASVSASDLVEAARVSAPASYAPEADVALDIEALRTSEKADSNGDSGLNDSQEIEPKPGLGNFFRILSFSTVPERCVMILGVLTSIGAGVELPLSSILFGRLTGAFTSYFIPGSTTSKSEFLAEVDHNALLLLCLFIAKFCLSYISIFAFRMTGIRVSAAIRLAYLKSLFALPIKTIDRLPPGTATDQLTTTANAIQMGISDKLAMLVQQLTLVIAAYVIAFKYSWALTLTSSSSLVFILVVYSFITPYYLKAEKAVQDSNSQASGVAAEVFKSLRTVKSLRAEDTVTQRYSKWVNQAKKRGLSMSWITAAQFSPVFFAIYGNMGLTFWFGAKLYTQGDMDSVGNLVTVLFSVLLVTSALGGIVAPVQAISKAASISTACFKIIDAPQVSGSGKKDLELGHESHIRIKKACFAYPSRPETMVLRDLDLMFPAGKITAIVGPSGSGKSTIVGLLERWYQISDVNERMPPPGVEDFNHQTDIQKQLAAAEAKQTAKYAKKAHKKNAKEATPPQESIPEKGLPTASQNPSSSPVLQNSGAIFIGDYNIENLDLRWWRSQIGLVQQEPFLFNNTIFENIAMGLVGSKYESTSDAEKKILVEEACREAFADEFIRRLPEGYETKVGESGIKLSGGQRQRLAIARSIIKQPTILILDEATSSIDVRGERIVQAALDRVSKGRTTITIAHRLSTIKKADHIIVLKEGTAVEEGTHQQLLDRENGVYANLVHAQHLELGANSDEKTEGAKGEDLFNINEDVSPQTKTHTSPEMETNLPSELKTSTRGFFASVGWILYEQRRHVILYILILIGAAGGGAVFAMQAFIFSHFVTTFQQVGEELLQSANFWGLMFLALSLFVAACYATIGYSCNMLSVHVSTTYRREYFMSILGKPTAWFDAEENSSGTLSARLSNDPQQLQEILGANMALPLIAVFNVIGSTIISFYFGWKLTVVTFFAVLPVIITASFLRLRYELQFESFNAKVFAESSQFAAESIGAFRTVAALTLEDTILQNYSALLKEHISRAFKRGRLAVLVFALADSIGLCCIALTFWYGGQLLSTREYNVTQFFVVYIAIVLGSEACGQFLGFGPNMAKATAAANRILGYRGVPEVPYRSRSGGTDEDDFHDITKPEWASSEEGASINFDNVSFTYPTRDVPVYQHLSLSIAAGEYVAFVGPSGCGKTTVISLLERFYDASSGQIRVGNAPITTTALGAYRQHVALVSQEPTLFEGTVRENLTLGLPDSTDDAAIEAAARAAEIHDFIVSLPQGYGTPLAAGTHASLSGGQKQRLCIARALLRRPRLLLLDEATSSLDSQSERLVQRAIERTASGGGVTIVAVAHRLATVQNADRIVVVGEGGRIAEEGSHAELVQRRGVYWAMCRAQALDR